MTFLPPGSRTTCTNPYVVSRSASVPCVSFTSPGGSAMSPMITTLAASAGRRNNGMDTRATSSAAISSVRCVPTPGISSSAAPNVPMMAPTVAIDESRPLVRPARSMAVIDRRNANGDAMPISVTGTEKSSSVDTNEPTTTPMLTAANPWSARFRNGRAMNGSTAVASEPRTRMTPSARGVGCRSAIRPPSQYPSER